MTIKHVSMLYLKTIHLQNFMGYRNVSFDFFNTNQKKSICIFFGQNGIGKSTILNAISLVNGAINLKNRDNSLYFKKLVYNTNYDPVYSNVLEKENLVQKNEMRVEAIFDQDGVEKRVILTNSKVELCEIEQKNNSFLIDADNPNNLVKFQLVKDQYSKKFLNMAKVIYNYDCYFDKEIFSHNDPTKNASLDNVIANLKPEWNDGNDGLSFYTDFTIIKYGVHVHYKQMSGGEKKIATLLSQICDSSYIEKASIVLIDSFEKEIYFKRHGKSIDKLLEEFPDKQFFIATHSETLINHVKEKYGTHCLYDMEEYKLKDYGIEKYEN